MSGGGSTKMNEEYFTEHPWSGDNGSHEDWEKVLTLKALALGGNIMYLWVRGEGPEITAANLDRIGTAATVGSTARVKYHTGEARLHHRLNQQYTS